MREQRLLDALGALEDHERAAIGTFSKLLVHDLSGCLGTIAIENDLLRRKLHRCRGTGVSPDPKIETFLAAVDEGSTNLTRALAELETIVDVLRNAAPLRAAAVTPRDEASMVASPAPAATE